MSLFAPARREVRSWNQEGKLGELLSSRGMSRPAGLTVTPRTALKHPAVNACVNLIAELATWPTHGYRLVDGRRVRMPIDPMLLRVPSPDRTPIEWRREVIVQKLLYGNAFGMVLATDATGLPTAIELIPSEIVTLRNPSGARLGGWEWLVDGQPVKRYPDGPLWLSRGMWTFPGVPVGVSPVEMACGAIGLGLAAEDFGRSWFLDGAHPSAVLESDQVLTQSQAKEIKARFLDAFRGSREPAALGAGLKYRAIQVAANESQFLETLDKNIATVCRFFLVPPEVIGGDSGSSMTYSNVEARGLQLLQQAYGPWVADEEEMLTRMLPAPESAGVNVDALLRVDAKTRWEIHDISIGAGVRSPNEVRKIENEPDRVGGDVYQWPPKGSSAPKDGAAQQRAHRIEVDARTTIEPGAVAVSQAPVTVTPAPVNVDARTSIEPGAVTVDARSDVTVPEREVHVDARTDVAPAEVNVTAPAVNVQPAEVRVDAPVTVQVPEATPRRSVRSVERDGRGDIVTITDIEVPT